MKGLSKRINKVAIIGKGTAGCISASYLRKTLNAEIEWIYDSEKPAQSVGEGSTIPLARGFFNELNMNYAALEYLGGSIKKGIRKIGYNGVGDYLHEFPLGELAIHFSSKMLQDYIPKVLESKGVDIIDKKITSHDEVDADYIIDCSGYPKDMKGYNEAEFTSVNAAHIVQSPCRGPLFDYTFTVARPFGWIFAIPLADRTSCGYLYNKDINTLEEVTEDMKAFMEEYRFPYSDNINSFEFQSYHKKEVFTERATYNGNAAFFLEPLEATSVGTIDWINRTVVAMMQKDLSFNEANSFFTKEIKQTEHMIMLHYLNGSKYNTPFWDFAKPRAEASAKEMVQSNLFRDIAALALKNFQEPDFPSMIDVGEYGQWPPYSYFQNFKGLAIAQNIDNLIREFETSS